MALSIKTAETDQLARSLTQFTGEDGLRHPAGQRCGMGRCGRRRFLIVVEYWAIVLFLFGEASLPVIIARHHCPPGADPDRVLPVASHVETGTVPAARRTSDRERAIDGLNALLAEAGITLAAVDGPQARLAL